jgi:hypothetical protein
MYLTLSHVDQMLGDDREINRYTTAVTANRHVSTTIIGNSNRGTAFSVQSMLRCYKQKS